MAIKRGFGLEKETGFVSYEKNFKKFNTRVTESADYGNHRQSSMKSLGNFAVEDGDITVYVNSPDGRYGSELTTKNSRLSKDPKETVIGFVQDTEKYAQKILPSGDKKRTFPFGSVPGKSGIGMGKVPGSYHFNMTMPYDFDTVDVEEYGNKLKKGVAAVRLLQPLFLAVLGGTSLDAVGNPKYLEGSQRQVYANGTSGIGFGDLSITRNDIDRKISRGVGYSTDAHEGRGGEQEQTWRDELNREFRIGSASYTDIRVKSFEGEKVPTIEYRFLDTFDTRATYDVFKLLCLVVASGKSQTDVASNRDWTDAMKEIAKEGWNAYVSKKYVSLIEEKLSLSLNISTKKIRADLLLSYVIDALWKKSKDDLWITDWTDGMMPSIHNFNKDSWEFYMIVELQKSGNTREKMLSFLSILLKINTRASSGWMKVNWKNNLYGVRDILLDDNVVGRDFGFEDTEDILHLLARYEIITIKEDKSGRIDTLKVNYSNEAELKKKLKPLFDESEMLNGNDGLLNVDVELPPEEIVSEPAPLIFRESPSTQEVFGTRSFGNITLRLIRSDSEDARLNLDDLSQVFSYSNIQFEGRDIRAKFYYAKYPVMTVSDDFSKAVYWNKTDSRNISIYLRDSYQYLIALSSIIEKMKTDNLIEIKNDGGRLFGKHPSDSSIEVFWNKLLTTAREEYDKTSTSISVDRAGVESLSRKGLMIISYKRGDSYSIQKLRPIKNLDFKRIQYIPYQKGYYVKKQGNKYSLFRKNIKINEVNI